MRKISLLVYVAFFGFLFYFFYDKDHLIVDSILDIIINPKVGVPNLLYSWNSIGQFGSSQAWGATAFLFPFGLLYYVLSLFLPINIVQAFVFSFILWLAFTSFSLFIQNELDDKSHFTYLGSIFYTFNFYTLLNYAGASALVLPYSILPLQLLFLNKILLSKNYFPHVFGFGIASLFMTGINPPLVAINIIVMAIYLLYLSATKLNVKRDWLIILNKLVITFTVFLFINAYWLQGTLVYFSSSANLGDILSEPLSMHNAQSSYLNVLKTLGLYAFNMGWNGQDYYNYAHTYLYNPLFNFSLFIIPTVALFVIATTKKVISGKLFFPLLLFLTIPMCVGINQGFFAPLYQWAYDHVPFFSMFRGSYKFIQVYIFGLSIVLSYFVINLKSFKIKILIFTCLLLTIIINAFPFFTGRIFEEKKKIASIPQDYYQAQKFFENDKSIYRILLTPAQYFAIYKWGSPGANPEILWNKGLVANHAGSGTTIVNIIASRLYKSIFFESNQNTVNLLNQLQVKYIVQRNDYDWQYYKEISQPPSIIRKYLSNYDKIASYGDLDVYKIPDNDGQTAVIGSENIVFTRINPSKFKIYMRNLTDTKTLKFLESFDKGWHLYLQKDPDDSWCRTIQFYKINNITECDHSKKFFEGEELSYLWQQPVFNNTHNRVYDYANEWKVDANQIKGHVPKEYYKENSDGSIDIELTLYFTPQSYFYLGLIVSGATLGLCVGYLLFTLARDKMNKHERDR